MQVNSEAFYATRPIAPYAEGKIRFIQRKDGTVYAIYLPDDSETKLARYLVASSLAPAAGATITLVGSGRTIPWERSGAGFVAHIPDGLAAPARDAWVFKISHVAG